MISSKRMLSHKGMLSPKGTMSQGDQPASDKRYWNMTIETRTEGKKDFIKVEHLKKYFPVRGGVLQRVVAWVQAVDDVSFTIREGETLGMVGESGCGKTTVGRTMLRLVEPTAGSVIYQDTDVFKLRGRDMKAMRRNMQIIFQDPYASLDPRVPIGESVMEGLNIHNIGSPNERFDLMMDTLKKVGLESYHARRYPHEFSGGQRQRIGIARALYKQADVLVFDEATSALDDSTENAEMEAVRTLGTELTVLMIAHRLSTLNDCDHLYEIKAGQLVSVATSTAT